MNKLRLGIVILGGLIFIIGIIYLIVVSLKPKVAGVYIDTIPTSSVWLDGREVGKTPYRNTVKPGENIVRLVPDVFGLNLVPYETRVNLIAGVETVIRYDFGNSEESSAGDIISFEKNIRDETSLVAVSIPDSAQLIIDGRERAFTPHKTSSIVPGEHQLKFSAQGYNERFVKVKIYEGYKLTAIVKLSKAKEEFPLQEETPSVTPAIGTKEEVEILSTDTGYLRVRSEPSSVGDEVGRVEPGKRYALLETDPRSGWYRIEYEVGKSGWVSNQYARKIVPPGQTSASPSATLKPTIFLTPTPTVQFSPTPSI